MTEKEQQEYEREMELYKKQVKAMCEAEGMIYLGTADEYMEQLRKEDEEFFRKRKKGAGKKNRKKEAK